MIKKLWHSTLNLHKRFNVYPPNTGAVRRVVAEEIREVLDAAKEIDAIQKLPTDERKVDDLIEPRERLADEIADAFVTLCALAIAYSLPRRALRHAAERVKAKNDAKIPGVTHDVNRSGKIARKVDALVE
jgi:hypothetical protein